MLESIRDQFETSERRGRVQHLVHLKADHRPMPSSVTLDRIADRALSGGFKVIKSNLCPECREYRSVNGACAC